MHHVEDPFVRFFVRCCSWNLPIFKHYPINTIIYRECQIDTTIYSGVDINIPYMVYFCMNITKLIQARQDAVEAKLDSEKDDLKKLDPVLAASALAIIIDAVSYGFDEAIKFVELEKNVIEPCINCRFSEAEDGNYDLLTCNKVINAVSSKGKVPCNWIRQGRYQFNCVHFEAK